MARKNPMVRMGRPPKVLGTTTAKSPMASLSPGVPAVAFKTGGSVGYKTMPGYHDCPAMMNFKRKDC